MNLQDIEQSTIYLFKSSTQPNFLSVVAVYFKDNEIYVDRFNKRQDGNHSKIILLQPFNRNYGFPSVVKFDKETNDYVAGELYEANLENVEKFLGLIHGLRDTMNETNNSKLTFLLPVEEKLLELRLFMGYINPCDCVVTR